MDFAVRNIQPVRIFQYEIFSPQGQSSTNNSASTDFAVRNIQSVWICSTKYAVSQYGFFITKQSVSKEISVTNSQPVGMFQYEVFSP